MGLGLTKLRLDEEILKLAPTGGSGLPSGPAGGALTGAYPNPGLAPGAATGTALGADVLTSGTLFTGDVSGLWNALVLAAGSVTSPKLADGSVTGSKLGPDVAKLVGGLVPPANLGSGTADVSHVLSGIGTWITPPGGAPSGAAGGSLAGSYPNPTLAPGVATGAVLGTDVVVTSVANLANGYAKPDAGNLILAGMLGTGTASSTTFLRGDRTWAAGTAGPLSGLSDVAIATPVIGQILTRSTSTWINAAPPQRFGGTVPFPAVTTTPHTGLGWAAFAGTASKITILVTGGTSVTLNVQDTTAGVNLLTTAVTVNAGSVETVITTINNPSIVAGHRLALVITAVSGNVTQLEAQVIAG